MKGENWEAAAGNLGSKYPHRVGAVIMLVGVAWSYWQIGIPLQQASAKAKTLDYSGKLAIVGICLTMLGLLMIVVGQVVKPTDPPKKKILGVVVIAAVVAISTLTSLAIRQYLVSQGYTFTRF